VPCSSWQLQLGTNAAAAARRVAWLVETAARACHGPEPPSLHRRGLEFQWQHDSAWHTRPAKGAGLRTLASLRLGLPAHDQDSANKTTVRSQRLPTTTGHHNRRRVAGGCSRRFPSLRLAAEATARRSMQSAGSVWTPMHGLRRPGRRRSPTRTSSSAAASSRSACENAEWSAYLCVELK